MEELIVHGFIHRVSKTAKIGDDDNLLGATKSAKQLEKTHKFEVKARLYYRYVYTVLQFYN